MGSMIGAGIFAAIGPAAAAAGSGLLIALAVAAMVAFANATASAQLAAVYPAAGAPTYMDGSNWARFGGIWPVGAFVVGKTASLAAMALTLGAYAYPGYERPIAVAAVVVAAAVNYLGVKKTANLTKVIVATVLAALVVLVVAAISTPTVSIDNLAGLTERGARGVLQAAGLLFFAFAVTPASPRWAKKSMIHPGPSPERSH